MATYTCKKCGMSIGSMTCGKCGKELKHGTITTADGKHVHVSECPDGPALQPKCCCLNPTAIDWTISPTSACTRAAHQRWVSRR